MLDLLLVLLDLILRYLRFILSFKMLHVITALHILISVRLLLPSLLKLNLILVFWILLRIPSISP